MFKKRNKLIEMENQFEIVAGSYEEYLLGYKFVSEDIELKQSFAAHDHTSSVRTVASSDNILASGGADDRVIIYDMKSRKEHCMLTHHNGTINCLAFANNTHLLIGGADGILSIVRIGNWQLEKLWEKPHKGLPLLDIAVHNTGKMALTVGGDCTLRTWNLIKGRQAYAVNLNSKCKDAKNLEHIEWAPCGVRFLLFGGIYSHIWSIETGGILLSVEHKSKVICAKWLTNKRILVGYENGQLGKINANDGEIKIKDAHNNRVKALTLYDNYLITASSNGQIKIWNKELIELKKCETGCRLTCLCILPKLQVKTNNSSVEIEAEEEVPSKKSKTKDYSITVKQKNKLIKNK